MRTAPAILACALALAGCGGSGEATPGGHPGADRPSGYERLPDAPRDLAALREQQNELLGGGADAFEARLRELEGRPVVVNKWASWCTPCRAEFPWFATQADERGAEIAFIGVDSGDNDADAAAFLDEFPVPYPSYTDPDLNVAAIFKAVAAFPSTAFYDSKGELAYLKQGGYTSEQQLVEDIERYAR